MVGRRRNAAGLKNLDIFNATSTMKSLKYSAEFTKGLEHILKVDPTLRPLVEKSVFPDFTVGESNEYLDTVTGFEYLTRSVIGQQVSGAAAASIFKKFRLLYGLDEASTIFPSPKQVIASTVEELRSAGLSFRKAEYIQGVAKAFESGEIEDRKLQESSDDEVVDSLVALKGIGPWTADMFMIFCLRHMDVFSVGDLGVQKGVASYLRDRPHLVAEMKSVDWSIPLQGTHSPGKSVKAKNRKVSASPKRPGPKLPTSTEMEWVAARFRPYRTVLQLIMWKYADTNMEVFTVSSDKKRELEEMLHIDLKAPEQIVSEKTVHEHSFESEPEPESEQEPELPESPIKKRRLRSSTRPPTNIGK